MNYSEDATQAAHYLREAIPLMVKYNIHPNPRNFALWYAYVSKSKPELISQLDTTIQKYDTCPPNISSDLFRRFVIDDEVNFAQEVRQQLSNIVGNLSEQTDRTITGEQTFENQLNQSLDQLQESSIGNNRNIEDIIQSLIHHTKNAATVAAEFSSEISKANSEIKSLKTELENMSKEATLDSLTQLKNRRAFDRELIRLVEEATNSGQPLSLLMTDIDHFKKCNDTYGHVIGDKVLQAFAQLLTKICGRDGFVARYGGEEFMVLLPNHRLDSAQQIAEQIRTTMSAMKIKKRGTEEAISQITTSLGVAQWLPKEYSQDFVIRADGALYKAKESGRNKVIAAPTE